MSNLPTGQYEVVLLRSYLVKLGVYVIEFVLADSGDRESCICLGKSIVDVIPYSGLTLVPMTTKSERLQTSKPSPLMDASLVYSTKYKSTSMTLAQFTGRMVDCDIPAVSAETDFAEF